MFPSRHGADADLEQFYPMIFFVVQEEHAFGLRNYLRGDGLPIAHRFKFIDFKTLFQSKTLERGTYVFSGVDPLNAAERELAAMAWDALSAEDLRLINHPQRALRRYDLLRALYDNGLNDFQVRHATDSYHDLRYPVFIRETDKHTGNLTQLLETPKQVDRALVMLSLRGFRRRNLLVVEFQDTSDEQGYFRKYAAYRVGDTILPRTLKLSRDWMVKGHSKEVDRHPAEEELDFVVRNPHGSWVHQVFEIAGVEYGRLDYSLLGDKPQAWEINLCPTLGTTTEATSPAGLEYRRRIRDAREIFDKRYREAWEQLDGTHASNHTPIPVAFPQLLLQKAKRERRRQVFSRMHRKVMAGRSALRRFFSR